MAETQRVVYRISANYVIHEAHFECLRRIVYHASYLNIGRRWRAIPGGMVVDQDNSRRWTR